MSCSIDTNYNVTHLYIKESTCTGVCMKSFWMRASTLVFILFKV